MFDKNKFAQVIKNIKELYNSQEEFAEKSGIGRTYLSQYMNMKLEEPPKPKILEKLANASNDTITYKYLMNICGYTEKNIENQVSSIYKNLKEFHKYINNGKSNKDNSYEIEGVIEDFQGYLLLLYKNITSLSTSQIFLNDIFNFSTAIEDYKYISGFMLLYNEFLRLLEKENYIAIKNYTFINCFDIEDIYNNLNNLEHLELFSLYSKNIELKNSNNELTLLADYINSFSRCLTLAHLSQFDSNSLIELFKKKAQSSTCNGEALAEEWTNRDKYNEAINSDSNSSYNTQFYICPVYGQISAGIPNWAEENIEGILPIDPDLMNIANPEECFFLRVNGESMNKLVKNGGYALIRKQDMVENGEVAVILVNGYDATLKKFSKQGDLVVLEPISTDPSFTTQVYSKDTPIRILGKYIGKFEMN